jgi:hypothetical protein
MIKRCLTTLFVLGALCSAPVFAQESTPNADDFRQVFYDLLVSLELAAGVEADASLDVLQASTEEIQGMFQLLPNKERFFNSAQHVIEYIASGTRAPFTADEVAWRDSAASATAMLANDPFPPDYPPGSGIYHAKIVGELQFYQLLSSHDERCNSAALSDYWAIWWEAHEVAEVADGICSFISCDPTGIACAIGCGLMELYMEAVTLAERPLSLCSFHDANIDSSELQAGFENSVGLIHNLNEHDAKIVGELDDVARQIGSHDMEIKAELINISLKLDDQQATLESLLANQEEIIELLNTPQGNRPNWNDRHTTKGGRGNRN